MKWQKEAICDVVVRFKIVYYIISSRNVSFCAKPRDWRPKCSWGRQLGEAQKELLLLSKRWKYLLYENNLKLDSQKNCSKNWTWKYSYELRNRNRIYICKTTARNRNYFSGVPNLMTIDVFRGNAWLLKD
jgi:hypothetical protein